MHTVYIGRHPTTGMIRLLYDNTVEIKEYPKSFTGFGAARETAEKMRKKLEAKGLDVQVINLIEGQ